MVDCTPYTCAQAACLTSCEDNSSCSAGFCVVSDQTCCPLTLGGTISVDAVLGSDTAGCCGVGTNAPCQTITRAMALIDKAGAAKVTISATVDGGGGYWEPTDEIYPIVLGWGVELSAPGVYFRDPNVAGLDTGIMLVTFYSAADSEGSASLVGAAAALVHVGMDMDSHTGGMTNPAAILVENGSTLYLANANINSNANYYNIAIDVTGGSTLSFGQDQSGDIVGTVYIGNALKQFNSDGYIGIDCSGNAFTVSSHIVDATLTGQSSVVMQGQEGWDIYQQSYCDIALTSAPVMGIPPSGAGFTLCGNKVDENGIYMSGSGTTTVKNGTFQCFDRNALWLAAPGGTMDIQDSVLRNSRRGMMVENGSATAENSTFIYNIYGVVQQGSGTIDLSGGGDTVICSSVAEAPPPPPAQGVDVLNQGTSVLNASNVAWDTAGPDYFICDSTLTSCTCNLASCVVDAGTDGMDAVEDVTNQGGIITTGNTLSPLALDAGCI